jgi:hypothetical protein
LLQLAHLPSSNLLLYEGIGYACYVEQALEGRSHGGGLSSVHVNVQTQAVMGV